jgi:hypothetical protein
MKFIDLVDEKAYELINYTVDDKVGSRRTTRGVVSESRMVAQKFQSTKPAHYGH